MARNVANNWVKQSGEIQLHGRFNGEDANRLRSLAYDGDTIVTVIRRILAEHSAVVVDLERQRSQNGELRENLRNLHHSLETVTRDYDSLMKNYDTIGRMTVGIARACQNIEKSIVHAVAPFHEFRQDAELVNAILDTMAGLAVTACI